MAERPPVDPEMAAFYGRGEEAERLQQGAFRLEFVRTMELLERYLPAPPAGVLDCGGGPGAYAVWLAGQGYEAHLLDPIALHVEQAQEAATRAGVALASAQVGDARALAHADDAFDAVLLLGPLYHLTEREDRLRAGRGVPGPAPGRRPGRGGDLALRLDDRRPLPSPAGRPELRGHRGAGPARRLPPQS